MGQLRAPMGQIIIKDRIVLFDDSDAALVAPYQWHLHKSRQTEYARGYDKRIRRNAQSLVYMHRLIVGFSAPRYDHRNGNGLDNRRTNLRLATQTQNNANRRKQTTPATSRFKGVHFDQRTKRWRADIHCKGVRYRLGRFDTEIEAAKAYREKATSLFDDFTDAATLRTV